MAEDGAAAPAAAPPAAQESFVAYVRQDDFGRNMLTVLWPGMDVIYDIGGSCYEAIIAKIVGTQVQAMINEEDLQLGADPRVMKPVFSRDREICSSIGVEVESAFRRWNDICLRVEGEDLEKVRAFAIPDTRPDSVYRCTDCGNKDQTYFEENPINGTVVCRGEGGTGCGSVLEESMPADETWVRRLEDKEDTDQHGQPHEAFLSAAYNMRSIVGKQGSQLQLTQQRIEQQAGEVGRSKKTTRLWYKDNEKTKAFRRMKGAAIRAQLSEAVLTRAKRYFSIHRDLNAQVQHRDAIIAACMVRSYHEIHDSALFELHEDQLPDGAASGAIITHIPGLTRPTAQGGGAAVVAGGRQQTDTAAVGPTFQCPKCQQTFNAKRSLMFHKCETEDAGEEFPELPSRKKRRR